MVYFSTILLSVFITISLIPMMIRLAETYQMVDLPNPRKVHVRPVPRIGGLAMALGVFVPVVLWALTDDFVRAFVLAAGVLVVFGFIDDMKGLGYRAKFSGQIIAALIIILYGGVRISSLGSLLPGDLQPADWLKITLTLVAIVGVTNAFNLADGLDGLAGGVSLLSLCCIGYLAYLDDSTTVLIITMAMAGAIFGFLRFNTHPASLFMGDTGSQLLGFSAIVTAIKTTQGNTPLSPVLPLIILGLPVLDTLTVMVRRISRGTSPFHPDKDHFHHRLIGIGLSHAESVFVIYVIQALLILSAIFFKYQSEWLLIAGFAVFSAVVVGLFSAAERKLLRLPRFPRVQTAVKDRLRRIIEQNYVIKISFGISKLFIPLLLLVSCFLPARIPGYVAITALCSLVLIPVVFFAARNYLKACLRLVLYLAVPLVLYSVNERSAAWLNDDLLLLYRLCFIVITVFMVITMRFSRRRKGFRTSTMDFLIIFIAITVPNLTGQMAQHFNLGLLTAEIIVLFFGYELVINELRDKFNVLSTATFVSMAVLTVRGFAGM